MHKLLTGPLTVERVPITIADLPSPLKGTVITQLSDFHFDGLRLSPRLLAEAIAASNAANPDLVMLTGDFITKAPEAIHTLTPWLKTLQSRCGIYAVLGNHDLCYRRSQAIVTDALTSIGIHVLWNEVVYPLGPSLAIVGLADYWTPRYDPALVMNTLETNLPRLVLSHNPDTAASLQPWRVDLQLSGHTHGGQIKLPGLGNLSHFLARVYSRLPKRVKPFFPIARACHRVVHHWEWAQGLHQVGRNQLYINRGLGTYLPGRLCCPPEVTVIELI